MMTIDREEFPKGMIIAIECDDERLDRATRQIMSKAISCVEDHQMFTLVMSSNITLDRLYQQLMVDPDLRGMPWDETQLWKLNAEEDDESFRTISFHSGMPEENVHAETVHEQLNHSPESTFDCCILCTEDIESLVPEFIERCGTFIVLAEDRKQLSSCNGINTDEYVFWFTKTIDLNAENL